MEVVDFNELKPFFEKFLEETDRACGILSGVLLDSILESLLRKLLLPSVPNEIFGAHGVLGTFAAKIELSYYLGHISSEEFFELNLIRKIRNDFAHAINHNLTFGTSPVVDRVNCLQFPKLLTDYIHLAKKPPKPKELQAVRSQPRKRFEISVGIAAHELGIRISAAKSPTSPHGIVELFAGFPARAT